MIKFDKVTKKFKTEDKKSFTAVRACTFHLKKGAYIGIAGNSGCGKSTLARLMAGLIKPTSGRISYNNIATEEIQIIFQHPESALNPKMIILSSLLEPIRIHKNMTLEVGQKKMKTLMDLLGLSQELLQRYPHEISGGEAQRICICGALLMRPKILILDEATSMLDVSTQASILNVLKDIRKKLSISMVMISHDLELLYHQCDEIFMMSEGQFVEGGMMSSLGRDMQESFKFFYD